VKILVVRPGPNFSVADVAAGWTRAFTELGHEVADLNLDDRLTFFEMAHHQRDGEWVKSVDVQGAVALANSGISAVAFEFRPDLAVIISGFYVDPRQYAALRAAGIPTVLVHTESPYEDDRQLGRAPLVDLNILNDPTNLDRYPPGTLYLPHAYDPNIHNAHGERCDRTADVVIVGTGYPSRIELLEAVDWTGIDLALAGNWPNLPPTSPLAGRLVHHPDECLPNVDAARLYRSARMSINIYRREAQRPELSDGWSMGPREVELAACRTFFVTEARGENRDVLPMIPTFSNPEELETQIRHYLDHPVEAATIAHQAHQAIAGRTFTHNVREVLRWMSESK